MIKCLHTIISSLIMYKTLGLSIFIALTTTACGFHLKGTPSTQTVENINYPNLTVEMPQAYQALKTPLEAHLSAAGIQLNTADGKVLKIVDYQFRRQQLNGKLTEILLSLNVTFRIEDAQGKALTAERTVRSYRNYQYDVETVNTENQQEQFLSKNMIDDIAQQISLQISHNRLPNLK